MRAALRRRALSCLVLGLGAGSYALDWQELGPAPISSGPYTGRVSAVVCSPTNSNRYFVAGADGGVWRTTDGGASWTPLTDDLTTTAIGALTLDPTDENILYAGTGEANFANHSRYGLGLFKSLDGGDTWTQLAEPIFAGRCFSRIVVHPGNPQTLYAAITQAGGFPALSAAKGHPQRTGPVGVFRSDDGGVTWTQLLNGLPALAATDLAIHAGNPNVLYAGVGHIFGSPQNGVYKSTDGGASWNKLAGGLPTDTVGRVSVAVAPSQPDRLYALITRPSSATGGAATLRGAFRSDDAGATWTSLPAVPTDLQATYGWYLSLITIQPTSADTVFFGGVTFVRSTNAGTSWSTVTPPHVDLHAAAWDAAGRLLIGDDGGVHRTANLGASWSSLNTGLGLIQFYAGLSTHPSDPLTLFGGTQDNGTNRRTTNSRTWTGILGGDGGWTQVDANNPSIVFAEFQGSGNLYRSLTGGGGFSFSGNGIDTADRNCFTPPYLIDPTNSNRLLYGTHRVYLSSDGGMNWLPLSGDLSNGSGAIRTLALAPSNPNTVYAATNDGNVRVSFNGGADFQLIASGVPGWPRVTREIFVDPADPLTAYLAVAHFGQTQIRRTRDGGQTWQPLDAALPDIPVNVVAVDVRGRVPVIYAGTDAGLLRSVDDGGSWHVYGSGLPNVPVIDLRLEPARERLVAATQGRGVWSIAIAIPGDLNCDGILDFFDIDPFLLALSDPVAYDATYPNCDSSNGDMNGDGVVDFFDVDPFVELLFAP